MQPVLERLPIGAEESFVVKFFDYAYYPTPLHFHSEYELVLVTESTGKRFIGDNISEFKPGDLALIGAKLPHLYRNDEIYYQVGNSHRAKSIVVHFLERSFGEGFLSIPETDSIKRLLLKSTRGMNIIGKTNTRIAKKMHALCELKGFSRWLLLVDILHELSLTRDFHYISNEHVEGQNESETKRINVIFDFVLNNYHREIQIAEAAGLVNLAVNSFSRFFSKRTRKTFTNFVNEVRLGQASKLLIANSMNVSEICFSCGFNNLSNFNRQFKKVYGISPLQYRKQYWTK